MCYWGTVYSDFTSTTYTSSSSLSTILKQRWSICRNCVNKGLQRKQGASRGDVGFLRGSTNFIAARCYASMINSLSPVAAPGRQGSQVISRSLRSWGRSSCANARAVKEPGHFEVRKSSRMHFLLFFLNKVQDLFSRHPQSTCHCQNKTNKAVRYGDIYFFFSHYYRSKAIGRAEPGRSQGGGSSIQVIWPGAPWCSVATVSADP